MRPRPITARNASGYEITDDPARIDARAAHDFLRGAYWSQDIPEATVRDAVDGSWCFALLAPSGDQVGFARLITDYATYAYLADVYVVPDFRGRGLAVWLMETIFSQPVMRGLRRITLATRDAHALYEKVGFLPLTRPEIFMEIVRPDIYRAEAMRR